VFDGYRYIDIIYTMSKVFQTSLEWMVTLYGHGTYNIRGSTLPEARLKLHAFEILLIEQ